MKKAKKLFIVISLAAIALFLATSQAWALGGEPNPYGVDKKAAGDKYSGTVTIYFEETEVNNVYNMYFFARMSFKKNWYHFSYVIEAVPYELLPMLNAFHEFIEETLIEEICQADLCPSFENGRVALKDVSDQFYSFDYAPAYFIGDIVIAVQP
jgi:hypothetical protein